ncbi:MAG: response regulator, partial [Bacteroidia bacterium]
MNILIVDDHELVRSGLLRIVAEEFSGAKVKEACSGLEAEKHARLENWSIIIMDMSMPDKTGLDVL